MKLMTPTTNALSHWRWNVETTSKCTLHCSRRFGFTELTNAKYLVLHSSHLAHNYGCCALGEIRCALAVVLESLGYPLPNDL
jgi:hypothetical protein